MVPWPLFKFPISIHTIVVTHDAARMHDLRQQIQIQIQILRQTKNRLVPQQRVCMCICQVANGVHAGPGSVRYSSEDEPARDHMPLYGTSPNWTLKTRKYFGAYESFGTRSRFSYHCWRIVGICTSPAHLQPVVSWFSCHPHWMILLTALISRVFVEEVGTNKKNDQ